MSESLEIIVEMTLIDDEGTVKSVKNSQKFSRSAFPECIGWNILSALRSLLVGYSPENVAQVVQELDDNLAEEKAIEPPPESG